MVRLTNGLDIVITDYITKTVRARKHKKRRIDKKWLKRYGYKEVLDDETVYHMDKVLYMTSGCYEKFKKKYYHLFREE